MIPRWSRLDRRYQGDSGVRIRRCPYCNSNDVRLSHRKNFLESALSFLGVYPFRCENCNRRFRKLWGKRLV